MKICKFCTNENSDEALFCAHCGARLDETSTPQQNETNGGTGDGFFDDPDPVTSENQTVNSGSENGGNGSNSGGFNNGNGGYNGNGGFNNGNGANFGGYNGGYGFSQQTPSPEDLKAEEFKSKARGLNRSTLFLLIAIAFTVSTAISVIAPILSGSFGFDLFSLLITIAMWRIYLSSKNSGTIVGYNLLSGTTKVFGVLMLIGAGFAFIGGILMMISAETCVEIIRMPEVEEVFIENNYVEYYEYILELFTVEFFVFIGISMLVFTALYIVNGLCLLHYSKMVKGYVINFNRGENDASFYSKSIIFLALNIAVIVLSFAGSFISPSMLAINAFSVFTVLDIISVLCEIAALALSIKLVSQLKEIK